MVSASKTWDEVLARFEEKFQAKKSAPAIRSRVKKLGLDIDHLRTHQLFTKAEKDYFDELVESGFKGKEMYERFWERFGERITAVSLTKRLAARKKKKRKQTPHCEYQTADGLRKKPVLCRNVWMAACGKPKSYLILDGSLEMVDLTIQSVLRGAGCWRRRKMLRTRSQVYTTCKGTRQHRTIHGRFLVSLFSWS